MKKMTLLLPFALSALAHAGEYFDILKRPSAWKLEKLACVDSDGNEISFTEPATNTPENEFVVIRTFSSPGVVQLNLPVLADDKTPLRKEYNSGTRFSGHFDLAYAADGSIESSNHLSMFVPSVEFLSVRVSQPKLVARIQMPIEYSHVESNGQLTYRKNSSADCTAEYARKKRRN